MSKQIKYRNKYPGQMMIEVVIAMAIAMVVLVALMRLATRGVSDSSMASRQAQATNYASEGIEWVKQQKVVLGWEAFKAITGNHCMNDLDNNVWSNWENCNDNDFIDGTEFTRIVGKNAYVDAVSGKWVSDVVVTVWWWEDGRLVNSSQSHSFSYQ